MRVQCDAVCRTHRIVCVVRVRGHKQPRTDDLPHAYTIAGHKEDSYHIRISNVNNMKKWCHTYEVHMSLCVCIPCAGMKAAPIGGKSKRSPAAKKDKDFKEKEEEEGEKREESETDKVCFLCVLCVFFIHL